MTVSGHLPDFAEIGLFLLPRKPKPLQPGKRTGLKFVSALFLLDFKEEMRLPVGLQKQA
jgi:hypothetical protein